ncbi:myb/SANT-like domain-containing protein [Artemisia annua]|uniref:Myb/SANT-like domain-containing protein n=1 Tax=Artemisia annua TaxID=35608 RepID=A0A2U1LC54_ARTAN|nr:myb/SANT-like domain-containing protein [Artemisia annua]
MMIRKKRVPFYWPYQSVLALCEIFIRYLSANGRSSPFKWVELQPEFEKVVKTELYRYKVLKNKYGEMRKYYSLCSSLKNGETGLGWNANTMTLS